VAFLRISGLPPFLGFFIKLEIFFEIIRLGISGYVTALLIGSMAFVYIYTRFFFSLLSERGQVSINEKLIEDRPVVGLLLIFSIIYPWVYMYRCKA
jgi:NADH:ubiquinone oxidoreductase subunit 2 (subunit N)